MSKESQDVIKMNPTAPEMKAEINEMSADEFRRSFYTWFEDNGLVSELRKNLRTQLVNTLKTSNLGSAVWDTNFTGPLKAQIFNVLIAEYLVNMNYLFSLSVYSTEVPFINIFPECKSWLNETKSSKSKRRYFTEKKVLEILELLGFSTESEICKRIIHSYLSSEDATALIPSIISLMSELSRVKWNPKTTEDPSVAALNYEFLIKLEPWLKEIYTLLSHLEIPRNILYDVLTHLRKIFLREQEKIKIEETTNFNILQAKIQKDLQKKEFEIAAVIADLEQTYFEQKQRMLEDFAKEQSEVSTTIEKALKREAEYIKLTQSLEEREQIVKQREKEVTKELAKLESRVKLLQDAYDAVLAENIKLSSLKEANSSDMLNDNDNRELLRLEYEYLREEVKATKDALQQFSKTIITIPRKENPTPVGLFVTKTAAERIQNENLQLAKKNKRLEEKVDELTEANVELRRELDIALRTTQMLANRGKKRQPGKFYFCENCPEKEDELEEIRKMFHLEQPTSEHLVQEMEPVNIVTDQITVPSRISIRSTSETPGTPVVAPTTTPRQNTPGGETSLPQPRVQNRTAISNVSEYRKTVPSRLIVHSESESSSSRTPTDEVLQEARTRLRSLERASAEVENNYRAFRQRQLYAGLGQQSQDLTNKIRENNLRRHLIAQSKIHDDITGLRKNPSCTDTKPGCSISKNDCFQAGANVKSDVPLTKINASDYYTTVLTNNNVGRNTEGTQEVYIAGGLSESKFNMFGCESVADADAKIHTIPSSSDYRSSSVELSEFDIHVRSLSISSIDISSDFAEARK